MSPRFDGSTRNGQAVHQRVQVKGASWLAEGIAQVGSHEELPDLILNRGHNLAGKPFGVPSENLSPIDPHEGILHVGHDQLTVLGIGD